MASPHPSTHRMRRRVAVAVAAAVGLGWGVPAAAPVAASPVAVIAAPVTIDVLTINDIHGHIENDDSTSGAAALAGVVDHFRDAGNTLVVSAGDNIGASAFTSSFQQDSPTLDVLNAIGLDASALGDQEFDQGRADLDDRVIPAANFPYLSANLYDRTTGQPAFEQYEVTEVDGISIGFIGAMTNELPTLVNAAGIATLEVRDVVTEVNRVAADLHDGDASNGEADVTILLLHEGAATSALVHSTDTAFGRIVADTAPSVAAIVSAHTHQLYSEAIPVAGQLLPRPVIQAARFGQNLGHLSLSVDPESHKLVSIAGEILSPIDADRNPQYSADPEVEGIVTAATQAARPLGVVKIGEIYDYITVAGNNGGTENRGGESTLGNFIADVQLASTAGAGAEIALMNPGGLGSDLTMHNFDPDLFPGDVSYGDAATVHPFPNTLVTMDLSGAQLRQVLEQQWQPSVASWPFLKLGVSGSLFYTYDPAAPIGHHITDMFFNGVEIAAGDTRRVVVNSFLASGGDNFVTLGDGANRVDSGRTELQAMIDYFATSGTVSPPEQQRAIGVNITPPVDGGYRRGQRIEIQLSSVLMSGGEEYTDRVYVQLSHDGDIVKNATYRLDRSIVDGTDELGRSTMLFTIPLDAPSGLNQLAVQADGSARTFSIPIVVTEESHIVGTTTTASVQRHFVSHTRAAQLRIDVVAVDGSAPNGTIDVFDSGKLITTKSLSEQTGGRVTTGITGLSRGLHNLTVSYGGNDRFHPSDSTRVRVVVY